MGVRFSGLAVVISIALGAAAHASEIEVKFQGKVASAYDPMNIFGENGTSLEGYNYSATYLFDDNLGTRTTFSPYLDSTIGGPSNLGGGSDPSFGARLTINGVTLNFTGAGQGYVSTFPLGSTYTASANDGTPATGGDDGYLENEISASGLPSSLDTPFSAMGSMATITSINGEIINESSFQAPLGVYASGYLDPTNVSVSLVSATPEPFTWVLMLAGVGCIGLILQRTKRREVTFVRTLYY